MPFLSRLLRALSLTGLAFLLTLFSRGTASASDCSERFPFGVATLRTSDHAAGIYGADLALLHGGWNWGTTFGLTTDVAKSLHYVREVAELVRDCVGDLRAGRLSFARHQVIEDGVPRPETDPEYFDRIFDDLVALRVEIATIENNFPALLQTHAPLVPTSAVLELKGIVSETLLRVLQHSANRTTGIGWIVEQMQALEDATADFMAANALVRSLIATYLAQYPSMLDTVINRLQNNTLLVMDQYEQFFSAEKRAALEALLAELDDQRQSQNIHEVIANLNALADQIEDQIQTVWMGPLRDISSKLKFIFGGCLTDSAHPLTSSQYFGDLPVSLKIVQEGSNAAYCN